MRSKLCAALACAVLGVAGTAAAQEAQPASDTGSGKLGIGVAATGFVRGLDAQFKITEDIALEGVFNLDLVSPEMGDSVTTINVGVRGLYTLSDLGERVDLAAFGGLGIGSTTDQDTLIGLEAGLKLYYAIVPFMLLHIDLGVAIGINSLFGDDGMGVPLNGTIVDIGRGDLFGGGGLLFIVN
jgi:hypothetical protein